EARPPPQGVDRLETAGRHQPGAWIGGHALARPLLEGGAKGVVQRLFGEIEVAEQAYQGREDAARLTPVDRLHFVRDGEEGAQPRSGGKAARPTARWRSLHPRTSALPFMELQE